MSEYLSIEQVCGKLAQHGVDEATVGKIFASRLKPENLDDTEKKFVIGVPCPGRKALLVVYRFGLGVPRVKETPFDEGGPDWRPRFIAVEGPFQITIGDDGKPDPECEALRKSRELTSG